MHGTAEIELLRYRVEIESRYREGCTRKMRIKLLADDKIISRHEVVKDKSEQ